jgi:uncharacterized protein YgbK (DUF1537 family)
MRQHKRMAVVADDVTGANDIGSMFAKAGYLTHVYSIQPGGDYAYDAAAALQPDICILDTNSRLDSAELAYGKVYAATRRLREAGWTQFFNKTCSVFRGNIGAEFDAMLDALGEQLAVVVLGFPKNGRATVNGIHYVHGKLLEESEFRHDPMHPMRKSNLVEILQEQTARRVGLVTHEAVGQGPAALRAALEIERGLGGYVILDVLDQAALATIARAVYYAPVLCGSSALGEELPAVWDEVYGPLPPAPPPEAFPPDNGLGILCVAGSLMPQTRAQVAHLGQNGTALLALATERLFDAETRRREEARLAEQLAGLLRAGRDAVLHSPNEPAQVQATREAGASHGYAPPATARLVSGALAAVTAEVMRRSGQQRLVIAGGETAAAVCNALGVDGLRVWEEIQPGLPSCLSLGEPPLLLVLKSGSFGSVDFLQQAIAHVRGAAGKDRQDG